MRATNRSGVAFGVDWKDGTIVLAFEIDTVTVIFHDDEKYGIRIALLALCASPCAARDIMRSAAPAARGARRAPHSAQNGRGGLGRGVGWVGSRAY